MGITDTTSRITYSGDGATTAFVFNFRVFDTDELSVIVTDNTTGVETAKTLTTHYTVVLDSDEGGTITMLSAPAAGETLYIGKAIPETQPNSITVGNLRGSTLEEMYDRLTMLIHQVKELAGRSPKFKRSTANIDKVMGDPVEDYYLRWDASGNITSTEAMIPVGGIVDGDISASAAIALGKLEALTANKAVVTDGAGEVVVSATTDTEIGYITGLTSAVQTQIDAKLASASVLDEDNMATDSAAFPPSQQSTKAYADTKLATADLLDEDNMATDSAVLPASQQSIKAYVDTGDALAVLKSTLTTKGDLYAATASATIARLGIGTNGQVLTAASGQTPGMEWATPSASTANLAVVSKTTTYTILVTDDLILNDTSGGAYTLTLPTAVGNTGKQFIIKYTDSGFANALTVDGSGTETIDGDLTTTLNTQGETLVIVSDGTNWEILDRKIPMVYTAYTPADQGFGTLASIDCVWARDGKDVVMSIEFRTGTCTGVEGQIGLPGSLTVDSTAIATAKVMGVAIHAASTGGGISYHALATGGDAFINLGRGGTATDGFAPLAGNTFNDTNAISFTIRVPVTQWNG